MDTKHPNEDACHTGQRRMAIPVPPGIEKSFAPFLLRALLGRGD